MEKFSALLALCAGTLPVTVELPTQRPVTRSFDVFVELCVNKQLSKQSCGWCFQTPVSSLWRHCNECSATYWLLYKASLPETNVKKRASILTGVGTETDHLPNWRESFSQWLTLEWNPTLGITSWWHGRVICLKQVSVIESTIVLKLFSPDTH